ncbi:MAG: hypothetical protein F6K63_15495 [Moorea sp. SIO1G6]|uniref:hypothetical protein n=1 Tax=Moorena sp. SIO1G6 TaxID=2607840 RepID=UPI0013BF0929|nr:hypothetical protein [Moorena sp. SIO1G6]NET65714.1 hypothetical protein [Moorena sp. SIO1G6]
MGETTAVAHGGDPQDRAASPRPHCLPKTVMVRLTRNLIRHGSHLCIAYSKASQVAPSVGH